MRRKSSFRKLRASGKTVDEAVASVFDHVALAIIGATSTGSIIYANPSAGNLFGCPKEGLEGIQVRTNMPGMTAAQWSSFWSGLDQKDSKPARTTLHLSGREKLSVEFRVLFALQSGLKYCLVASPGESPADGVNEEAPERPLELVLNIVADPVIVLNEQQEIIFLNRAACQALGTTVAKASGKTVYDYMPERLANSARKEDQRVLDSMRPATYVGDGFYQARYAKTVTLLPILVRGTSRKQLLVIYNGMSHGNQALSMVMPDSHEPVPGMAASGHLSELYEGMEGGCPLGIFLKNTENRYLWVNQAFARMTGLEIEGIVGKRTEDLISDPEILAIMRQEDDYVYSTGKPLFNQIAPLFNSQSGSYRLDKFPFINRKGELAGIIGLAVGVDESAPPIEALKHQLASTSKKLVETETALRVLIERREQDVSLTREELNAKVRDLLVPYLENLKQTQLTSEQAEFVELIETNLKNFYDPAYARLSSPTYKLSPTELKVAQFIRDGKSNKEIARLLHLSKSTILTHRHHLRVKLGIRNKKVNLRSLLNS